VKMHGMLSLNLRRDAEIWISAEQFLKNLSIIFHQSIPTSKQLSLRSLIGTEIKLDFTMKDV